MCTGLELALAASAAGSAMSVYSQVQQGKQADAMADLQTRQAQADADYAASSAQVQARQIRKAADRQRSQARAALASSGVAVEAGSAELVDDTIQRDAEEDALMAIYDGTNNAKSIRQGGEINAFQSRGAANAARYGALGSALSGAATVAKGWNVNKKAA